MNTLIVIPAFNEEKSLAEVIKDLKTHGYKNILVVDDGSTDSTSKVAQKNGAQVLRHIMNRGLGAALGTGFLYASENEIDALITFDGDGQHQASDLKNLLKPIELKTTDVVVGSRFKDLRNIPVSRKIANLLANFSTFALYGVWTTDSQSGLRAFNKKALGLINIKTERMEVSSEFFKEIHQHKLRYQEIPIKAIYTNYSLKNSKQGNVGLSSVKIGYKMMLRLFR